MTTADGAGPTGLVFEDFVIGRSWTTSRRTITEADITIFAGFSGDYNPVHVDEEYARTTAFGGRVLHGLGVLGIATGLESRLGIKEGTAIAFLGMTWDMQQPVRPGDTVHVHQTVASVRPTAARGRGIVTFDVSVVNQSGAVCQSGQWVVMFLARHV